MNEEETIRSAVDAAIAGGVLEPELREGIVQMCRTGFADLRARGENTSDFIVEIDRDRPDGEPQIRVRPPRDRPMTPALVETGRTREQLLGTYRTNAGCRKGECVCQFEGQRFPLAVLCSDQACPVGAQVVATFADMPYWARMHRRTGCPSESVGFIPMEELLP